MAAVVAFLLLMVLILAIKLHRRNRELDEMELFGMQEDDDFENDLSDYATDADEVEFDDDYDEYEEDDYEED